MRTEFKWAAVVVAGAFALVAWAFLTPSVDAICRAHGMKRMEEGSGFVCFDKGTGTVHEFGTLNH